MFTGGAKEIVCNAMHVRIPNGGVVRGQWLNLCIDVSSFVTECFTKGGANCAYKALDYVLIEGHCKLKKVFTSRSCVPVELEASIEVKSENLPVNLDFTAGVKHHN
jgi:hypothetical protein